MSLFNKFQRDRLNRALVGFLFHRRNNREYVHFCEHDGINIRFTPARTTWQAMAPCSLKPWWLFLQSQTKQQ